MAILRVFPLAFLLAAGGRQPPAAQIEPDAARIEPAPAETGSSESTLDSSDADSQSAGAASGEPADEGDEPDGEDEPGDADGERDGASGDRDGSNEAPEPPDRPASALELELTGSSGTRGDGAGDVKVRWVRPGWSIALGAGNGGGTQAVQRQWLRAETSVTPREETGLELCAGALWQPPQAGATQEELRVSAGGEGDRGRWELALEQESASLSAQAAGTSRTGLALSGASASLELAHRLPWRAPADEAPTSGAPGAEEGVKWSGLLALQGGLFSLSLPRSAAMPWAALGPWDRLGDRALAWPSRAQAGAGVEVEGAAGKLRATAGAGLPAEAGAGEAQLSLSAERGLGPATVSLELSAARLFPAQLWLGAAQAALRWRFALG